MTFVNLTFLKVMPSIQRLGAAANTLAGLKCAAGEAAAMLAPIDRYYGTSLVHFSAHSRSSIGTEY